eukprot:UN28178
MKASASTKVSARTVYSISPVVGLISTTTLFICVPNTIAMLSTTRSMISSSERDEGKVASITPVAAYDNSLVTSSSTIQQYGFM